ncbi:hypothetical protein EK21DRAFT_79138 [Setomelanomma holmii]|uniref:Uncharacterized protein n=1 Tax=Setomelanomma holmii TaxID=210430 RepID=A0A9P4LFA0_9PLEO|nr:hypothetical protein EK21DRAFT_79138 [Setomelanomma holmii]
MGKVTVRCHEDSARWHTPLLQDLSAASIVLPIYHTHKRRNPSPRPSRESIKVRVRKLQKPKMGIAPQRSATASTTVSPARRKRDRVSKPQPRSANNFSRKALHRKAIGPGTRIGTMKEMPITIADDDEDVHAGIDIHRDVRGRHSTASPAPSFGSFYYPLASPGNISPQITSHIEAESSGSQAIRGLALAPCDAIPSQHHGQEMTLRDIADFDMGKKVADLMAVAPALPVQDLYNLLNDMGGDLAIARLQAAHVSSNQSNAPNIKAEATSTAQTPQVDFRAAYELHDDDELMVKIDTYDAFLEWDSDTPPPPVPLEKQSRAQKARPVSSHSTQASRKRTTCASKNLAKKRNPTTSKASSTSRKKATISVRRHDGVERAGRLRLSLLDQQFVVPDDVVSLDSDDTSSGDSESSIGVGDSDIEMLNTVPEHLDNLRIQMRRQNALNEEVLNRQSRRMGGR